MDKTILVEKDIEEGRKVIEALKENGFPVNAAFWLYKSEPDEWRLTFASPLIDEQGPFKAYSFVQKVLSKFSPPLGIAVAETTVLSDRDELVEGLRRMDKQTPGILPNMRMRRSSINKRYVDDIYIYYATP